MQAQNELSSARGTTWTLTLKILFAAVLIGRFLFPFYHNPADFIYSGLLRNVHNGLTFLQPTLFNLAGPKIYPACMYALSRMGAEDFHFAGALFNGTLCSAMGWFWYRALRETASRSLALIIALVISMHLSLLAIYGFFDAQTVSLTLLPLGIWMSLRAVRKRTLAPAAAATASLMAALVSLPPFLSITLLALVYVLSAQMEKLKALAITVVISGCILIPAGWESLEALHFFSPLGIPEVQAMLRKSDHTTLMLRLHNYDRTSNYIFTTEAFKYNPLDPYETSPSRRDSAPFKVEVYQHEKAPGWERALLGTESVHKWRDVWDEYKENFFLLFFGYSWPDADRDLKTPLVEWNYALRWTWFPCFLLVLLAGPFTRFSSQKSWLLLSTIIMTCILLLQDTIIADGNTRKFIEPFLIASAFFICEASLRRPSPDDVTPWGFVMRQWLRPLLRRFLSPVFFTHKMSMEAPDVRK